ncbi:hypothetical protein BO78DRAFT_422941 [Aspergillus sclerotiicarbonarius CBS 121057]|uniref:Uncharacterized protein n=1 Tax=Aspergillus sclerotiicarbonarius (strain CBS 121057 / IBT 28362) TaxID=1448318 RepID=A0A319F8K5_ASPSB|nr:hypothetical protein BO78DRAFT_422941 [Aspergillus sclerotiicarbonarius CBS 121057]
MSQDGSIQCKGMPRQACHLGWGTLKRPGALNLGTEKLACTGPAQARVIGAFQGPCRGLAGVHPATNRDPGLPFAERPMDPSSHNETPAHERPELALVVPPPGPCMLLAAPGWHSAVNSSRKPVGLAGAFLGSESSHVKHPLEPWLFMEMWGEFSGNGVPWRLAAVKPLGVPAVGIVTGSLGNVQAPVKSGGV